MLKGQQITEAISSSQFSIRLWIDNFRDLFLTRGFFYLYWKLKAWRTWAVQASQCCWACSAISYHSPESRPFFPKLLVLCFRWQSQGCELSIKRGTNVSLWSSCRDNYIICLFRLYDVKLQTNYDNSNISLVNCFTVVHCMQERQVGMFQEGFLSGIHVTEFGKVWNCFS